MKSRYLAAISLFTFPTLLAFHEASALSVRMLKKPVQRFVKRESSTVKGFGGRALASPTFHGSWERSESAAGGLTRIWWVV